MDKISLERYSGLWYQIAAYPTPYTPATAFNVTAQYTLTGDGMKVDNSCYVVTSDGSVVRIQSIGYAVPASEDNRTLIVRFDESQPAIPNYKIYGINPDYTYAIITNPEKDNLFILSRIPVITMSDYLHVTNNLAVDGFDVSRIALTPQLIE